MSSYSYILLALRCYVFSPPCSPPMTLLARVVLSRVSTEYCMDSKMCRGYARDSDVALTKHGVNRLFELVESYQSRISATPTRDQLYPTLL